MGLRPRIITVPGNGKFVILPYKLAVDDTRLNLANSRFFRVSRRDFLDKDKGIRYGYGCG